MGATGATATAAAATAAQRADGSAAAYIGADQAAATACSLGATFMGLFGHLTRRLFTPIYYSPLSRWVSLLERGTRVMSTD